MGRLERERKTIAIMVGLYCSGRHGTKGKLCEECSEVLNYALERLDSCPYGTDKPACDRCPIHCYKKDMRAKIKEIMKYSGPKMIFRNPYLAIAHFVDRRKEPAEIKKKSERK